MAEVHVGEVDCHSNFSPSIHILRFLFTKWVTIYLGNPFSELISEIDVSGRKLSFYDVRRLDPALYGKT